jgi:rhodanese-related sulfurtransferase
MFKTGKTGQEKLTTERGTRDKFPHLLCGMLAVMLVLVTSLTSCVSTSAPPAPIPSPPAPTPTPTPTPAPVMPAYKNVTVDEAQQLIQQHGDLIILDVRTQQEYDSGYIPNAILIPVGELDGRLGELDKAKAILVYCKSGVRSAQASQILIDNEFSEVYNFEGGIVAWQEPVATVNHPPIIGDLIVTPEEPQFFQETNIILKGKGCNIECIASDPDNDKLSYKWSADGGSISGEGSMVTWIAPSQGGEIIIAVTVSDGSSGVATRSIVFTVKTCSCAFN